MGTSNRDVAEAFSRHEFEKTFEWMAPDIRWDVVGDRLVEGAEAVRAVCAESAAWLASIRTTFRRFDLLSGDGFVVADTLAEYVDDEGTTVVASCDVYRFAGDRLTEIRSFTAEV